jgi:hypothetical protein
VGDHGLIDPEAASGSLDTGEARGHRARHNHTSHFDLAVGDDLLDVVAEVRHGGKRVPPNRLFIIDRGGGEAERRVDYHVAVQQPIEGVEITRITGCQPSEHDRFASIHCLSAFGPAPGLDQGEGRAPSPRLGQLGLGVAAERAKLDLAQRLE